MVSHTIFQHLSPSYIVLLGAAIAAWGAFKGSRRMTLWGVIFAAIGAFLSSSKEANFYKSLLSTVTGGDSFCYVTTVESTPGPPDLLIVAVKHQGKYPLYDVQLDILDKDKLEVLKEEMPLVEARFKAARSVQVGTMPPRLQLFLEKLQMPTDANEKRYYIGISARNGVFAEDMTLRRVKGRWIGATKVIKKGEDKAAVLHEKIHPDFPRDENGQVLW